MQTVTRQSTIYLFVPRGALREMLHYILNLMMVDKDTVILHWFTQSQSHVNIKVTNYNCYV